MGELRGEVRRNGLSVLLLQRRKRLERLPGALGSLGSLGRRALAGWLAALAGGMDLGRRWKLTRFDDGQAGEEIEIEMADWRIGDTLALALADTDNEVIHDGNRAIGACSAGEFRGATVQRGQFRGLVQRGKGKSKGKRKGKGKGEAAADSLPLKHFEGRLPVSRQRFWWGERRMSTF